MNKQQAQQIIRDTFESSFDKVLFTNFIKNLLNSIDESKAFHAHGYVKEGFRGIIKTYERVGTYNLADDKKIDIIIVYLQKGFSLDHARVTQRNFAGRYLADRGSKNAGLFAFVSPEESDWRFSLVTIDYEIVQSKAGNWKGQGKFSQARRWSFLVGANEKSHTAQSRLVNILANDEQDPTLEEIQKAFDIETVTKEFFLKYRALFLRTKEELDRVVKNDPKVEADFEAKSVDTVNFAKKLLGQIIFLYFLQKKGWFGVGRDDDWGTGSKHFLRELFDKKHGDYKNFFNDILEPLFYEALRIGQEREQEDYYYSRFDCKIPFLNGGLFDPIGSDGGYNWVHTDIFLPDKLFSNSKKTKEGDTGDGILDIFDRYNFTVKEDEPLEKEVAIDPELLGKAYEKFNAIRPDNYDEFKKALKSGKKGEENKFNKKFGVYYTPREIVHYMCQQSLINYLETGLESKVKKEAIEFLILEGEKYIEHLKTAKDKKEANKNYRGYYREKEHFIVLKKHASEIDNSLSKIKVCDPAVGSGAFPVGMMIEIIKSRMFFVETGCLENIYINSHQEEVKRTTYNYKRDCIEHSLYGVDIDPGAVEIAKLRLWLSLVVDEEDIKRIKPLPNLDYKIVCGNSLLGVEKNLFNNQLFSELERLKPLYFNEANPTKKQACKNKIDDLITQITNGHTEFDFDVYFSEVFHEKSGFDVVIGNPPYVEHKKLKGISSQLKNFYSTYSGTADLYVYFYEKGVKILRQNGLLVFITSNKFIKTRYGENLRKYFAKHRINEIIDFTDVHVFEALVASCIFSISRSDFTDNKIKIAFANDSLLNLSGVSEFVDKNSFLMSQKNLSEKIWQLEKESKLAVKEKIEDGSVTLKETRAINIYRGVTTGYNPAFIIDKDTKNRLIKSDKKNCEIIKPLLQGRNIRKWIYHESNQFLLQTGFDRNIKSDFPYVYSQLALYKENLQIRDDQGKKWYNLRACKYYSEFEKEKIIWGLTANKWAFAYDDKGHYLPSNGYILTSGSNISIKYVLALLNSNLLRFYFGFIGIMTAGGAYTLKHETISAFPIKEISSTVQQSFITIVDRILAITKNEDYLQNPQKQAQVKALEREIDQMVYELYGLTDEEIKIVEEHSK